MADILRRERRLPPDGYRRLITARDASLLDYLNSLAREVAQANYGNAVYVRGLVEVSNYCRNTVFGAVIATWNGIDCRKRRYSKVAVWATGSDSGRSYCRVVKTLR